MSDKPQTSEIPGWATIGVRVVHPEHGVGTVTYDFLPRCGGVKGWFVVFDIYNDGEPYKPDVGVDPRLLRCKPVHIEARRVAREGKQ